jgi:hypothetical protein
MRQTRTSAGRIANRAPRRHPDETLSKRHKPARLLGKFVDL